MHFGAILRNSADASLRPRCLNDNSFSTGGLYADTEETAAARRGPVLRLVPQHDQLVPMEEVHGLQRLRVIYCVE